MKISKNIFKNNEVVFFGFSRNSSSFSRGVYDEFVKAGIKVYPINKNASSIDGIKVYSDISQLPKVPECAYVLLNSDNTNSLIKSLVNSPIKTILFQNKNTVDSQTFKMCKEKNIKAIVACPKMILSKGLVHRIHGMVAGVR